MLSTDDQKYVEHGSVWLGILRIFWDMRWPFLGFVVVIVGIHFAFEYGDVLFPNQRPVTALDAVGMLFFGGLIVWSHISSANKRIAKLEEDVEELQRKAKR